MPEKKPKNKKAHKHPEVALYKALRQRQQDATEFTLREYFETDGAAAGFSSSFGALTDMALAGPGGTNRDPDARLARDGRLLSVKRHRAVIAALRAVPNNALVLWAAYGDHRLPGEVYGPDYYGPFAGVALLTETAKREYGAEVARREAALKDADEAAILRAEIAETEAALAAASADNSGLRDRLAAQLAELASLRSERGERPSLPAGVLVKQGALQKLKGATIGEWLRSGRSKDHRPTIRQEADALLREARAAFQARYDEAREELRRRGKGPKPPEAEREPTRKRRLRASTLPAPNPQPLGAYHLGGL